LTARQPLQFGDGIISLFTILYRKSRGRLQNLEVNTRRSLYSGTRPETASLTVHIRQREKIPGARSQFFYDSTNVDIFFGISKVRPLTPAGETLARFFRGVTKQQPQFYGRENR
jgi:hypothetical protein